MKGEDALSTIEGILQAIGELARDKGQSNNAYLHTLLRDLSAEQDQLRRIQQEAVICGSKSAVGLTEEAAAARAGLRKCIIDVRKTLLDLRKKVKSRGFEEMGLAGLETFQVIRRRTTADTLRECYKLLRASRVRAEKCQAFNIAHRSWEKNRPSDFVKVDKFYEILSRLRDDEKKVVIIHGMFGIGKSALALEVATTLSRGFDYPGGVHFIVFGQEMRSGPQVDEKVCAELLNIVEFLDRRELKRVSRSLNPSMKKVRIREILQNLVSANRCLFVLDDVWNPEIVNDFVFDDHPGNVLVTMRSVDSYGDSIRFHIQPTDYMEPKLDQQIFTTHAHIPPEICTNLQAPAHMILDKCQGCPLALIIMGNAVRGKVHPDEWLRAAEEFSLHAKQGLPRDGYPNTMFQGVGSSAAMISAHALQAIGWFRASTDLPAALLRMAWIIQKQIDSFESDIRTLTSAHILEQTKKEGETFYWVHPIVSEYLIEDLHFTKKTLSLRDRYMHPADNTRDVDDNVHVFCAFLLTYGHQLVAAESAELLSEELGADFDGNIMEGVVHEVQSLTSKLRVTSELPVLKDRVVTATLASWGLAKVIQTSKRRGLSDLEQANRLQPDNAIIRRNLGVAHFILGDIDSAVANLSSAKELEPEVQLASRLLTYAVMGTSDLGNAGPALEMTEGSRRNDIFLSLQGLHKWKQGSLHSALEDLELSRSRNPYTCSITAAVNMELGNLTDAEADLETALAVEDSGFTRCMRGLVYLGNGEYGAAKAELDRALEFEPCSAFFLGVRGEVNRMLEKYDNAADDLERAVKLLEVPDSFTLRSLVNVKWMQGKFEEAIHLANGRASYKQQSGSRS